MRHKLCPTHFSKPGTTESLVKLTEEDAHSAAVKGNFGRNTLCYLHSLCKIEPGHFLIQKKLQMFSDNTLSLKQENISIYQVFVERNLCFICRQTVSRSKFYMKTYTAIIFNICSCLQFQKLAMEKGYSNNSRGHVLSGASWENSQYFSHAPITIPANPIYQLPIVQQIKSFFSQGSTCGRQCIASQVSVP